MCEAGAMASPANSQVQGDACCSCLGTPLVTNDEGDFTIWNLDSLQEPFSLNSLITFKIKRPPALFGIGLARFCRTCALQIYFWNTI